MKGLPYADELLDAGATPALSQERISNRPPGRLSDHDLEPLLGDPQVAYVCGSASFAESVSQLLVRLGKAGTDIRVERFGPTG